MSTLPYLRLLVVLVHGCGIFVIDAFHSPHTTFLHSHHGDSFVSLLNNRQIHSISPFLMVDESMSAYDEERTSTSMKRTRPVRPRILQTKVDTQLQMKQNRQVQEHLIAKRDPTLLSNSSFASIPEIHSSIKRAVIDEMRFTTMTDIQAKAFYPILSGTDVVGRARTGTGKTLAYLVPALERLFHLQSMTLFQPDRDVGILILSPIRELATQIQKELETLLLYPRSIPHLSIQVLCGATSIGKDIAEMNRRIPSIVVATPGRLLEHVEQTKLNNGRHFGRDVMKHTYMVILDEADRLLSMGFQKDIEKIISYLPRKEKRQTLLFSATIPEPVRDIIHTTLREDYILVDCVGHHGEETNVQVDQSHIILRSMDDYITSLVHIIHHMIEKNQNQYKIIVFFPTARLVTYFAHLVQLVLGVPVLELHSKKSPGHRHRVYDTFRHSKQGLLFTSDVSSRGLDYLDVTLVIQVFK